MRAGSSAFSLLAASALLCNAFVWGVSWWPFRQLQLQGLHPLWTTALVYLVALSVLLLVHFNSWRSFATHPQLWLLALAAGMTNVGFNWAVTVGDVLRVLLLFYLMPAWSVLIAWQMLGEKPSKASLIRLVIAMAGVLMVLKTPDSPWPLPQALADWLALLGGLSFAITNAYLRRLNTTPDSARMLAMFGGGALLAGLVALATWAHGTTAGPALQPAGIPIALGLSLAFILGNAALQYGASRLASSSTALLMLTEILFASGSAAWLGAATFTPRILIGGSLILLAAILATLVPASAP